MSTSLAPSDGSERASAEAAGSAQRHRLALVSAGTLLTWGAHNALLLPWEVAHIGPAVREPMLVLLRASCWMVPVSIYLKRHDRRPALAALGLTTSVNRRGLAWSVLGASLYLGLIVWLLRATQPESPARGVWETLARLPTLYTLANATLEELLMRGFLLGQLARVTTSARAQVCVALVFALVHLPAWLALQGPGTYLLPSLVTVLLLGAVLGGVARASNSVIPAIVLHFLNNMLGELLGG